MQVAPPLTQLVDEFLPTAKQMMRDGSPDVRGENCVNIMTTVLAVHTCWLTGPVPGRLSGALRNAEQNSNDIFSFLVDDGC
jgi:hypothetical protein